MKSLPITEILIFGVRYGVKLGESSGDVAAEAETVQKKFKLLLDTLEAQDGFISQYHGHQVETPSLFVWCISWQFMENYNAFINSQDYHTFKTAFNEVFDVEAAGPVKVLAQWNEDPTASMTAPITEIAFFELPNGSNKDIQATVEEALSHVAVQSVGKALGSAIGWAFEVPLHSLAVPSPNGEAELLHGVFGYTSIEAHMEWRATPEHAKAGEIFADLEKNGISIQAARVPGIDPSTGWFHVKFSA